VKIKKTRYTRADNTTEKKANGGSAKKGGYYYGKNSQREKQRMLAFIFNSNVMRMVTGKQWELAEAEARKYQMSDTSLERRVT
jgi:hypothetical protein